MRFYFFSLSLISLFLLPFVYYNLHEKSFVQIFEPDTTKQRKCVHPNISVWDSQIKQFYEKPGKCQPKRPITLLENRSIIELIPHEYDCWARCHEFLTYENNSVGPWITANDSSFECEVVETRCSKKGLGFSYASYFYLHTQIVEQELANFKDKPQGSQYNVHILLVDSTSHSQSIRNFPKLRKYLLEELGAVEFPYLNKYWEISRENMIALNFGKIQHKIERNGVPSLEPERKWSESCYRNLDNERSLFKEFDEFGYVTNYVDDWWHNLNYGCVGNKKRQSHHLYTPYVLAFEHSDVFDKDYIYRNCLERHKHALNYTSQFIKAYPEKLKFSFTWLVHIGHNEVWKSMEAEPDLLRFFDNNREEMDNSFVFLMSDHGLRESGAAQTAPGDHERNNPMLYVTVPSDLRIDADLMDRLQTNSKELQTHFDVRATILDILKYQPETEFSSRDLMQIPGELGTSFLRMQPLPRTCNTLPILPDFCICDRGIHEDLTEKENQTALSVAEMALFEINMLISRTNNRKICGQWRLKKVSKLILKDTLPYRRFDATVHVFNIPSNKTAIFKVGANENRKKEIEIRYYDRMDSFGSRGNCLNVPELRKICDCVEHLWRKNKNKS